VGGITREYDLDNGVETDDLPAAGTPSDDSDMLTLGYAKANFARSVADLAALKAITSAQRSAGVAVYVVSLDCWFIYNSSSTATSNDITIVTPTDTSGRWLRTPEASSFAIANNQVAAANITPLIFDKTKLRSVRIEYQIFRAATLKVAERGTILMINDDTNWDYEIHKAGESNVALTVTTTTGQVQYTSDSMGGSYDTTNSVIKYTVHPMEL
jgi:hypothetical protein